jgi:RNA polymerase sigma factor (sigma-70 family)
MSLRNRCLNYIRSEKYIQINNETYKTEIEQIQHLTHIDYLGEEEIPLEDKLLHEINFAIEKLPERCKIVFKMSRLENLKNKIIAQELGISVIAVEKQLSIGKEKITKYISNHYPSILFILLSLIFVFE